MEASKITNCQELLEFLKERPNLELTQFEFTRYISQTGFSSGIVETDYRFRITDKTAIDIDVPTFKYK